MHRGYIKLWRKIEDWEWYGDVRMVGLFIHLLIRANHKDTSFQGYPIPRGALVCGRDSLAKSTKLTSQSIRSCIQRLKSTNEITIKTTNKFSIISIVNFEQYQEKSTNKSTNKLTINQPTTNQQLTTSKEVKNVKNTRMSDEQFISALKADPFNAGVNFGEEFLKMDRWLSKPENSHRKKTRRFISNWIARADRIVTNTFTKKDVWQTAQTV